jgi:acyl carrier protein
MIAKEGALVARVVYPYGFGRSTRAHLFLVRGNGSGAMNIEERTISLIAAKANRDPADCTLQSSLAGDLGLDSLDQVELLIEVEREFGLNIEDRDAERIATVGDAVQFVLAQMRQESGSPCIGPGSLGSTEQLLCRACQ